jgi:hypothetical protein
VGLRSERSDKRDCSYDYEDSVCCSEASHTTDNETVYILDESKGDIPRHQQSYIDEYSLREHMHRAVVPRYVPFDGVSNFVQKKIYVRI